MDLKRVFSFLKYPTQVRDKVYVQVYVALGFFELGLRVLDMSQFSCFYRAYRVL